MSKENTNITAKNNPLTIRLYQSIRFNRPVDREKDYVSPGGYEIKVKDEQGNVRNIQFDFEDYEGGIDGENPCVVNCMQKNADYSSFEELNNLTEYMLHNIVEVVEWFIYTGEPDEAGDNPLVPVEIINPVLAILGDNGEWKEIPVTVPIKPESHFTEQ